ncbi:MAG: UPF0147 family protein [Candidatus Kariarchaeaceae archaeon]|jgi:uncharacterized protein (UPF0147 family)
MEDLIDRLIETIRPLIEDKTIGENEKAVIQEGYDTLLNENIDMEERVQLSCNYFDKASKMPYNPFHSRTTLWKALAIYEDVMGKNFERSDTSII